MIWQDSVRRKFLIIYSINPEYLKYLFIITILFENAVLARSLFCCDTSFKEYLVGLE